MKILIGTDTYFPSEGGIPRTIHNLISYLEKNNHDYLLVAPGPAIQDEKKIHRLSFFKDPFIKGKTGAYFLQSFIKIFQLIKKEKPDVIHIEESGSVGLSCLICSKLFKIKIIGTLHSDPLQVVSIHSLLRIFSFFEFLLTLYFRFIYSKCDLITVPTEMFRKKIGFKSNSLVISNGVDLEKFHPDGKNEDFFRKHNLPSDKTIFLYMGRLDPDKNLLFLINAISKIKNQNMIFLFAGSGSLIDLIRTKTDQYSNMFLIPNPSFQEIPLIYQSSDIFVIPSKIETQSMVTLEAAACGLPILAARAGSLPELCQNGVNGFLFDPDNVTDLAQKIELITGKDVKLEIMRRASRKIAEKNEINLCMQKYVEAYNSLINS